MTEQPNVRYCTWREQRIGNWEADCGYEFPVAPSFYYFQFCPFCAGKLIEQPWSDPDLNVEADRAADDPRHNQAAELNRGRT